MLVCKLFEILHETLDVFLDTQSCQSFRVFVLLSQVRAILGSAISSPPRLVRRAVKALPSGLAMTVTCWLFLPLPLSPLPLPLPRHCLRIVGSRLPIADSRSCRPLNASCRWPRSRFACLLQRNSSRSQESYEEAEAALREMNAQRAVNRGLSRLPRAADDDETEIVMEQSGQLRVLVESEAADPDNANGVASPAVRFH